MCTYVVLIPQKQDFGSRTSFTKGDPDAYIREEGLYKPVARCQEFDLSGVTVLDGRMLCILAATKSDYIIE